MREKLKSLKPYKVKAEANDIIRLDSNEAFKSLLSNVDMTAVQETWINRYPAESSEQLIEAYAHFSGFPEDNILPGNGSDEWIALICQYALDPGDKVLVLEPDFSMYAKNAMIMGADIEAIELNQDFTLPMEQVIQEIKEKKPSLFFLSNPNNPTGMLYPEHEIETLIDAMMEVGGLLVLDEAYIDFAGESAFEKRVLDYRNLIILRTASKALGMAALRLGFLIANDQIIEGISSIKPPYNVNTISAVIGTQLLKEVHLLDEFLLLQLEQIAELEDIMKKFAQKVEGSQLFPSRTNFFLMKLDYAKALSDYLYDRKIKVRCFDEPALKAIRISAGTKEEHAKLRAALNEWSEKFAKSIL